MRSLLVLAIPLAIPLALAGPSVAQAQVNCSVYGAQVYCPNGQNLTKYGTQAYGRVCTRYGTQLYCN